MSDYYPVIARWIADQRNAASRDELYWLARTELEIQLTRVDGRLTPSEMMRERLALEEAIRTVERECSRPLHSLPDSPEKFMKAQRLQLVSGGRMSPEVHPRGAQQQETNDAFRLPPSSIGFGPLMRFAGVILVIGLGSALYWQRDRVTALFVHPPIAMPHSVQRSLPVIDYYVGKLGEAGRALR